ncbi:MAG: acetyl-CoA carboxylase biotin carboxyl carrier protein subunit [Myxococcota bacterium]|nr:acetyl-CoA carboxylase biotin carboxyl carrier protein subunit [Myxococcota bacterium]
MRYEITLNDQVFLVEVNKTETGYTYAIDGGEEQHCSAERLSFNRHALLFRQRSVDVQYSLDEDAEIHFEGRRYVANIMDPRKKSIKMASGGSGDVVRSQMPGRVISILVSEGDTVSKGQIVATVEAMKMENPLKAPRDGVIASVDVAPGDLLEAKGVLLSLRPVD